METSLLLTLGISLLFAASLYYVFFVKRQLDFGHLGVAGMIAILAIITPIIFLVLFSQSGAEQRLEDTGFEPHPDFTSSVGIATGSGENPIWLFSTAATTESVVNFYKDAANHDGWLLMVEQSNQLAFVKNGKKMSISVSSDYVSFTLVSE